MLKLSKYRNKRNKKGVIELQFNWIFVLVVGGIILFFVYSLISGQKRSAELSINQEILRSIDAVVTSATTNLGTTNQIRLQPKQEINFECNKIAVKSGPPKIYSNLIMFAPNKLKGSRLITQTVDFSIPFRVSNFVYASTDDVRYILIGNKNDKLAEEVNRTISDKFNKEFRREIGQYEEPKNFESDTEKIIIPPLKDEKNYKVRVVFFNNAPDNHLILNTFSKMKDDDVTALNIVPNGRIGTVTYYKKNNNIWTQYGQPITYLEIPSLVGAIFLDIGEETESQYNTCIMENIKSRVNLVLQVYSQRIKEFISNNNFDRCDKEYGLAISYINNIQTNFNNIPAEIKNIEDANQQLQQKSCPLIY